MTKPAPPGPSEPRKQTDRSELFRNLALLVFPAYALIALLLFFWPQSAAPPENPRNAEKIAHLQRALEEQTAMNARQAHELEALRDELRAARATPVPAGETADATPAPNRAPGPTPTASPARPPPSTPTPAQTAGTQAAAPAAPRYTVRPGETLGAIAKAQCGSARDWREILAANAGQLEKAEDLRAGMVLTIPCAAD